MINLFEISVNFVISYLLVSFANIMSGISSPNKRYFKRFTYGRSIIYDISTILFHREKTAKFSYYSHFLMMNILKNASLNMNIFILRKFKPQKQSGIAENSSKSPEKKSVFMLRKNNVEFALKSPKTSVNPKEKNIFIVRIENVKIAPETANSMQPFMTANHLINIYFCNISFCITTNS